MKTFQLTAATSYKIVHNFKDLIIEHFDMENTYRHIDVRKMLSTQSAKRARCKIQITHAERYRETHNMFLNNYF